MSKTEREMREEFKRDISDVDDLATAVRKLNSKETKSNNTNKYQRECKGVYIDVYDVLKAFKVVNPATQHAIKKLLASGQRGYKDVKQDLQEARDSIMRAIELEGE